VVILLVSKLQLGRLVREPLSLKELKKAIHTDPLIALVLKLHSGRLVREPRLLKAEKN